MEEHSQSEVPQNDPEQEALKEGFILTKRELDEYGLDAWKRRNQWIKDSVERGNMSTKAAIGHTVEQYLIAPLPGLITWLFHMRSKSKVDQYAEKLIAEFDTLQKDIEEKAAAYAEATEPDRNDCQQELEKAEQELSDFIKNKGVYHLEE